MHVSIPIVPAPSTTTVPGSASGLSRNAWMQVATGSASTATSASSSSSITWTQDAGTATSSPKPPGRLPPTSWRCWQMFSDPERQREAGPARDLRVHGHAAADERLGAGRSSRHLADQLVAHDQRRRPARAPRRDALDVAAADPGALHADQDFARRRDGRLHVEDVERSLQRVDERTHRAALPAPVDEHLRVDLAQASRAARSRGTRPRRGTARGGRARR